MKIRIAIAEDNPTTRKQYLQRFDFYDHIEIVVIAENGKQLLNELKKISKRELPQIVLMDIEMPLLSGIETTAQLKTLYPEIEVMMLTVFRDDDKIFQSIQSGAAGYLLKDCSLDELIEAIEELRQGGVPLSKSIARKVLDYLRRNQDDAVNADENPVVRVTRFNLTDREIEILQAIVRDETEYAIAENLSISEHTVRTHVKNIYKKLQVHSRGAVVKAAYEHNLLPKKPDEK
ncbi:MAG: response regulator transcription factor [Calditrichia bacterium]